jgi:hypothetical protein
MKSKYLLLLLLLLESCIHKDKKPAFFSFQNKWGVLCFFDPVNGSSPQRTIFLPLGNPADSSFITNSSSIFEFKYGLGMDYHDRGDSHTNYKIYWISDHKKVLSEKEDTTSRVHWAFAKLRYHTVTTANGPSTGRLFQLTLINKTDQLPIETYDFNNSIAIDTAYFKRRYVAPIIDTAKLKLKIGKPRPGYYR